MDNTHMPIDLAAQFVALFNQYAHTDNTSQILYFAANDRLADSWVRANRKADASVDSLDIAVTFRPNVLDQTGSWIGFSFTVGNPAAAPEISNVEVWPEAGGSVVDVPAGTMARLEPFLRELVRMPAATAEPPRQSPETMY